MDWYVLFVRSGKEDYVKSMLKHYFPLGELYPLIPKRQLREKKSGEVKYVLKKMFPGYIFIRTDMDIGKYKRILKIPNLLKILNNGTDTYYTKVDENEMDVILRLIGQKDYVKLSFVCVENSKVTIRNGPLSGMEDMILRIDKHKRRAKICLNLMGEAKTTEVGIELINNLE